MIEQEPPQTSSVDFSSGEEQDPLEAFLTSLSNEYEDELRKPLQITLGELLDKLNAYKAQKTFLDMAKDPENAYLGITTGILNAGVSFSDFLHDSAQATERKRKLPPSAISDEDFVGPVERPVDLCVEAPFVVNNSDGRAYLILSYRQAEAFVYLKPNLEVPEATDYKYMFMKVRIGEETKMIPVGWSSSAVSANPEEVVITRGLHTLLNGQPLLLLGLDPNVENQKFGKNDFFPLISKASMPRKDGDGTTPTTNKNSANNNKPASSSPDKTDPSSSYDEANGTRPPNPWPYE